MTAKRVASAHKPEPANQPTGTPAREYVVQMAATVRSLAHTLERLRDDVMAAEESSEPPSQFTAAMDHLDRAGTTGLELVGRLRRARR
jgi:hypothetical protein